MKKYSYAELYSMGAIRISAETDKIKVLYVDDDLVTQKLVSAALGKKFEIEVESSGTGAILRAETLRPNLILLDLSMPHVDGFEVLNQLRHHPILSAVPVICLSGFQDEASRERAYKLGCAGFITKPIQPRQIASDIQNLLDGLNIEMQSADLKKSLFIGFNPNVTEHQLRVEINEALLSNTPCAVFSLADGESFNKPEYENALNDGTLLYLQIRPSLITRLPFLEDYSPVREDLRDFLREAPSSVSRKLFFHHFDLILNWKDFERTTASALAFNATISQEFQHVRYFWSASRDSETVDAMNRMARTLMGSF